MPDARPLRLGVNIDHVATLRQVRRAAFPSAVEAGLVAEAAGADGITLHLREDRRHIQDADVRELRRRLRAPMNLEMAVTAPMLALACEVRPPHACLVPERREELTTEGGLDVAGARARVRDACAQLAQAGIRVSLFIDADDAQLAATLECGAPAIEIHTGHYANLEGAGVADEIARIARFARAARAAGLQVHAGHGLTVGNVGAIAAIPEIEELNIGHAIVARAVFVGLPAAIGEMRAAMDAGR